MMKDKMTRQRATMHELKQIQKMLRTQCRTTHMEAAQRRNLKKIFLISLTASPRTIQSTPSQLCNIRSTIPPALPSTLCTIISELSLECFWHVERGCTT